MKYTILIVDDEPANLRVLDRLFRDDYTVLTAESGAAGLELLRRHDVALILSDQRMPGMTGVDFLRQSAIMRPQTVRVILSGYTDVTDLVEAINSSVVYKYITKPWVSADIRQTVTRAVEHYSSAKNHHLLGQEFVRQEERLESTVQAFVNLGRELIAVRSSELADHCRRTSNYAALIGDQFNMDPGELEQLIFASLLHEIVNVRTPIEININNPVLTIDQQRVMRSSFEAGVRFISNVPALDDVATIIRHQHEHYDGTGYFDSLDGEKIPFGSRVLAVANAFDEIHSGRNPELLCTDEEVAVWLRRRAGSEFDPDIVEVCLETIFRQTTGQTDELSQFTVQSPSVYV